MPVPSAPIIKEIDASNTGTNDLTLTFIGIGSPGGTVTLYDGSSAAVSGAVANDGTFTISSPTFGGPPSFENGHFLTLTTTDASNNESAHTPGITAAARQPNGFEERLIELSSAFSYGLILNLENLHGIITAVGTLWDDTFITGQFHTIFGRDGDDTYFVGSDFNNTTTLNDTAGNDRVLASASYQLQAHAPIETLDVVNSNGTEPINLTGNELGNKIVGNQGANILDGAAGADQMYGRGGDDTYFVDNPNDQVFEDANGGNDRVLTSVSYQLQGGSHVETLDVVTPSGTDPINLKGNEFDNTITGNQGANILNGNAGADQMYGRGGDDTYFVDNPNDQVFEDANGGNDRVLASVSYQLQSGSHVETLDVVSSSGTDPINLTGNEFDNTIIGNQGANILDGGAGADQMYGRGGDDTYFVDNPNDQVFEDASGGNDRVLASVSYQLQGGSHVETLDVVNSNGTEPINLTGNELDNKIVGNNGSNIINGGDGNDVLYGRGGSDSFLFNTALNAVTNVDTIGDFDPSSDYILLDSHVFSAIATAPGHLLVGDEFGLGSSAHTSTERVLYDGSTGALYYDSDGTGAAAPIQFATVAAGLAFHNDDFSIV